MIDTGRVQAIFWPAEPSDGVAEKPIAIGVYDDVVELRQGKARCVLIQRDRTEEFIRALRKALSAVEEKP